MVFLTGPRQSGKTTLARDCLPEYRYISLEDLQNRAEATQDPRGFLKRLEGLPGAILDEAPHTLDQSLAGRAAKMELLPFSVAGITGRSALIPDRLESGGLPDGDKPWSTADEIIRAGLFPPIHARGVAPEIWLDSYVRTCVERTSGSCQPSAMLSGCPGGMLVQGGEDAYVTRGHQVRAWWMCS